MAVQNKVKEVNLLPRSQFDSSLWGRALKWVLSTFRILVVLVEGVVILGFLGRFALDMRITDLNDEIEQRQIQIKSFSTFEEEYRNIQKRLEILTFVTDEENQAAPLVKSVSSRIPDDVFLTRLEVSGGMVRIEASSLSEQSVAQFLVNLKADPKLSSMYLTQLQTEKEQELISFSLATEKKQEEDLLSVGPANVPAEEEN